MIIVKFKNESKNKKEKAFAVTLAAIKGQILTFFGGRSYCDFYHIGCGVDHLVLEGKILNISWVAFANGITRMLAFPLVIFLVENVIPNFSHFSCSKFHP